MWSTISWPASGENPQDVNKGKRRKPTTKTVHPLISFFLTYAFIEITSSNKSSKISAQMSLDCEKMSNNERKTTHLLAQYPAHEYRCLQACQEVFSTIKNSQSSCAFPGICQEGKKCTLNLRNLLSAETVLGIWRIQCTRQMRLF